MWDDIAFANYIAGFAEGESSFSLSIMKGRGQFGVHVRPTWMISQVGNESLLENIKDFLGVGYICHHKSKKPFDGFVRHNSVSLSVGGKDCARIVEFFEKFPLKGTKAKDFEFWKRIVQFYVGRYHRPWAREELVAILEMKRQMDETLKRPKSHPRGVVEAIERLAKSPHRHISS